MFSFKYQYRIIAFTFHIIAPPTMTPAIEMDRPIPPAPSRPPPPAWSSPPPAPVLPEPPPPVGQSASQRKFPKDSRLGQRFFASSRSHSRIRLTPYTHLARFGRLSALDGSCIAITITRLRESRGQESRVQSPESNQSGGGDLGGYRSRSRCTTERRRKRRR